MVEPDYINLNATQRQERNLRISYPEFCDYLDHTYTEDITFQEKIYWHFNDVTCIPVCAVCGKKVSFRGFNQGYSTYCSSRCAHQDRDVLERTRQTCLDRYGVDNAAKSDEMKLKSEHTCLSRYGKKHFVQTDMFKQKAEASIIQHYGVDNAMRSVEIMNKRRNTSQERYGVDYPVQLTSVKDKSRQTCRDRYGVDSYTQTTEYIDKIHKTFQERYCVDIASKADCVKEKAKKTCCERYGTDSYTQTTEYIEKSKKTFNEHYGVDNPMQNDCVKQKIVETKRNNRSFNTSRIEERTAAWLDSNNIKYIRQYKSDLYPYCCDFYLPDHDLYIEIQGSWTHGSHPYNADSEEDTNQLLQWTAKKNKYYDNAIDTWTVRDTAKRQCAQRNNLNYIEIFSCDEDVVHQMIEEHILK